jgi:hypothetical protein
MQRRCVLTQPSSQAASRGGRRGRRGVGAGATLEAGTGSGGRRASLEAGTGSGGRRASARTWNGAHDPAAALHFASAAPGSRLRRRSTHLGGRDEIGIGMDAEESDLAAPTTKTRFDEDWLSALRR